MIMKKIKSCKMIHISKKTPDDDGFTAMKSSYYLYKRTPCKLAVPEFSERWGRGHVAVEFCYAPFSFRSESRHKIHIVNIAC